MMHLYQHLFSRHSGLFKVRTYNVCYIRRMCYSGRDSKDKALLDKARAIFDGAVKSVLPHSMVKNALKVDGKQLYVKGRQYSIEQNVHILAFGKAVIGMVRAAEDQLGDHVCGGVASVPHGIVQQFRELGKRDQLPSPESKVEVFEGAKNNLPDNEAHLTARQIYNRARSLSAGDIALVLMSGGGSALLPTPIPPVTINDLNHVTKLLAYHGATIEEMNTVRKQIETLKGGGLAEVASPAQVIPLVLSDVIGDPLSFIASGPTYPDDTTPSMCLDLFTRLDITNKVPETVYQVLEKGKKKLVNPGTSTSENSIRGTDYTHVHNVIIGSNKIACSSAEDIAVKLGYIPLVLSTSLSGDTGICGRALADLATHICFLLDQTTRSTELNTTELIQVLQTLGLGESTLQALQTVVNKSLTTGQPVCLLGAGETTVSVKGQGKGGRNQEMAMYWARRMSSLIRNNPDLGQRFNIGLLSAGTDGQDGPCEAAGALVTPGLIEEGLRQGLDPDTYLDNNDSFNYFRKLSSGKFHVVTGLTGTNVMDIQIVLIEPLAGC